MFWAFRVQGVCALGCSGFRDNSLELRWALGCYLCMYMDITLSA